MKETKSIAKAIILLPVVFTLALPIYAIPATLTLRPGRRPGLEPLTLPQAIKQLRTSKKSAWELVEAARVLVGDRMHYCRRNSFDPAAKAFARGYGYSQQMAFAQTAILNGLGFETQVVNAFQTVFSDGEVGGHAWVAVTFNGETRWVDPLFYDPQAGEVTFTPFSLPFLYKPWFHFLATWGSTAVNAHSYYRTGKDS